MTWRNLLSPKNGRQTSRRTEKGTQKERECCRRERDDHCNCWYVVRKQWSLSNPYNLTRVLCSSLFDPKSPLPFNFCFKRKSIIVSLKAGMADSLLSGGVKENKLWKGVLAVAGIMTTLVIYGLLQVFFSFVFMSRNGLGFEIWFLKKNIWRQEKIMRVPYGSNKEFFKYSLFLVFCNRITTSAVSAAALVVSPIRSVLVLESNVWTMGWFGILFS